MEHMPAFPIHGKLLVVHQFGWPVAVQKSAFIWMQTWCAPASAGPTSAQRPSRVNPVIAVPGNEQVSSSPPRTFRMPLASVAESAERPNKQNLAAILVEMRKPKPNKQNVTG